MLQKGEIRHAPYDEEEKIDRGSCVLKKSGDKPPFMSSKMIRTLGEVPG